MRARGSSRIIIFVVLTDLSGGLHIKCAFLATIAPELPSVRPSLACILLLLIFLYALRYSPLSWLSQDLWTQIGRFARLTKIGKIRPDLANYDDDDAGGSAWPCAIDDFVEYVQQQVAE